MSDLTLIVLKDKNQMPELLHVLHVYECRRGVDPESWEGALIIAAHHVQEASDIAAKFENWRVFTVVNLSEVYATGEPRVLYNDDMR